MVVVVPGVDVGAVEVEVAGVRTGVGTTRPVVAVGTAVVEETGVPVEVPAPEEGERSDRIGQKGQLGKFVIRKLRTNWTLIERVLDSYLG